MGDLRSNHPELFYKESDDITALNYDVHIDEFDDKKYIKETNKWIEARGGDGTLLKAINMHRDKDKPFFGIGGGSENFLMNKEDYVSELVCKYKKFSLLKVKVTSIINNEFDSNSEVKITETFQAFNDIFISEENGWIDFNCKDTDNILGRFKGSGLIISTSQGSTGINKNNNGVILPLSSSYWSITGDKTNRKVNYVLEPKKINISVKSRGIVNLFIDGNNNKIENIQKIEISKGSKVSVIFNNYDEFKRKRRV